MSFFRPTSRFIVAPGVRGFRSVLVNYFFVTTGAPGEWVLVDAGLRGCGRRLMREAVRLFGERNPPRAVLLTHGHFDHIGGLPWLLQHWDVPVYAHARELPFLNDRRHYPAADPTVGGGLMALSSPLFPRHPPHLPHAVYSLPADGTVPVLRDWHWIETPGHSPGHISFWRPSDRVLIAGDAVISTRQESALSVWTQRREVRPPPAYFTPDWRVAFDSLARLRALQPEILAPGHGLPMEGEALRDGLARLVDEFEGRGLPHHGRYVRTTWATG